ncbi:ParA family protein [Microbacterium horticulturae]|uniref:ParA family protein n=1 Tax=Microbacterium horticulturae TaxID=3028316 RepID=A0ABY8BWS8_9MICO|nr:ParA family protein [Microbacterium sp. KACC 23027]WEG08650.1 ParA family protein [Microbacterium sp. KACC 23027]
MRIIVVAGQKGGIGRTTVTLNLAAIAGRYQRVMVVDADARMQAQSWMSAVDGETEYELPCDYTASVDPGALRQLRRLEESYDLLFVDTSADTEINPALEAVLDVADLAIVPFISGAVNVAPLRRTVDEYLRPRGLSFRILLNMIDGRSRSQGANLRRVVENDLNSPLFSSHVRLSPGLAWGIDRAGSLRPPIPGDISAATDFLPVALELLHVLERGRRHP